MSWLMRELAGGLGQQAPPVGNSHSPGVQESLFRIALMQQQQQQQQQHQQQQDSGSSSGGLTHQVSHSKSLLSQVIASAMSEQCSSSGSPVVAGLSSKNGILQNTSIRCDQTHISAGQQDTRGTAVAATAAAPDSNRQVGLPTKLYAILSNPEYEHILSWSPHGYAWKIKDLQLFVDQILPAYFDFGNYPRTFNTFIRLLKLWGFRQLTKGPDTSAYYHSLFLRGKPQLLSFMRPALNNDPLHTPETEPDFYKLPPLQEDGRTIDEKQQHTSCASPGSGTQQQPIALLEAILSPDTIAKNRLQELMGMYPSKTGLATETACIPRSEQPSAACMAALSGSNSSVVDSFIAARLNALLAAQQQRESKADSLAAAKELHNKNLRYLAEAKMVADSVTLDHPISPHTANNNSMATTADYSNRTAMMAVATGPANKSAMAPLVTMNSGAAVAAPQPLPFPSIAKGSKPASAPQPSSSGSAKTATKKGKKPRRKWLPPLGPANPKANALCTGGLASSTSAAADHTGYDWVFTNAEVFASLSENRK